MLELSNKTYNIAKWGVGIVSPAFIALYTTLGSLWEWSVKGTVQVTGTVAAVTLFIGIILGISSKSYNSETTINQDVPPTL